MKLPFLSFTSLLGLTWGWAHLGDLPASGAVVINEIFYHAPNDIENLEYVELHNTGDEPAELGGWRLTKGIRFDFPPGTQLGPRGYLVVSRDVERFKEFFGGEALGGFRQALSNSGERIDLEDPQGKKQDSVRYHSRSPWSLGADGYSASLERICPTVDGQLPENWMAAPLSADPNLPTGTPGKRNAAYATNLPPVVGNLHAQPVHPAPGQPIDVEVDVRDQDDMKSVNLLYRVCSPGAEGPELTVAMRRREGVRYAAVIPAQKADQLVRFRVEAIDAMGSRRLWPAESEPRPAFTSWVHERPKVGQIPLAFILNIGTNEFASAAKSLKAPRQGGFGEADEKRFRARQAIESGIDLPGLWFLLVVESDQGLTVEQLKALRPLFTAKVAERDKLADDVVEATAIEERMKSLPDLLKSFNEGLVQALRPLLTEGQMKALAGWQSERMEAGSRPERRWTPERILRQIVKLEAEVFELTGRGEVTVIQLPKLRELYRSALASRKGSVELMQSAMKDEEEAEGTREKLEKRFEEIRTELGTGLKALLARAQWDRFDRWQAENGGFMGRRGSGSSLPTTAHGQSAYIQVDPQTGEPEVFDFVRVTERSAGYKVHFHKDRPLHGLTSINLLFEYNDRFVLAEPLAYEVYRRSGAATEQTDFVRLTIDGQLVGYQLLMEQPNRAFLQRHGRKGDGDLYKLLWYGRGVVGQHEKKTRLGAGHADLVELIDQLEKTKGADQWALIQKHFNVPQVANYFAVNTCLSHWDGFFNNYFAYHDLGGKWEMYPWDQDKTWGFYDGLPEDEVFVDMPLTFGMEGDLPPGWPKDRPAPKGFGGESPWWRPGGYFSKPLLANPEFRRVFLARTRELLDSVYTEEVFFPIIEALGNRLRDEVRVRAGAGKENPVEAVERFDRNLNSLRKHLSLRRKFLLAQEELKSVGPGR